MASQPDLIIRAGSVEFFGQLPPSGEGFIVAPDGLEGLDDGVASKSETVSRPQAHGDFDIPGFLDSRIVSISGACLADSPQRLNWFGSAMKGLFTGGTQQVVFDHMGTTVWGMARLAPSTTPKFKVNSVGATDAKFQLQLKFANPRLFGNANVDGPSTSVTSINYGNFPATSLLTVAGAMASGYTVNGPLGRKYIVTRALVAGAPHTIDMATGLLSLGGVTVFGGVSRADTWATPGGGSVAMTLTGTGTGTITATTRDTFI